MKANLRFEDFLRKVAKSRSLKRQDICCRNLIGTSTQRNGSHFIWEHTGPHLTENFSLKRVECVWNELFTQLPGVQLSQCNLWQPDNLFVQEWYGQCIICGGVINTNWSETWGEILMTVSFWSARWNEECFSLMKFAIDCKGGLGNMCLTKGLALRSANAPKVVLATRSWGHLNAQQEKYKNNFNPNFESLCIFHQPPAFRRGLGV